MTNPRDQKPRTPGRRKEDIQLSTERDLLSAVLASAGALILVLDRDGRIVQFNRACEHTTGYQAAEMIGKIYWEFLIDPADTEPTIAFFTSLKLSSFPESHERVWVTRSGAHRLIRWYSTVLPADDDAIGFVIATGFDITDSRRAELELHERTKQLDERVKELHCLYGISRLREQVGMSLEQMLQGVVELIPPAWQYPHLACAHIAVNGNDFYSAGFRVTAWRQASEVLLEGEPVGLVEVFYLEEKPQMAEGPFLAEERTLINDIADRVGRILVYHHAQARLNEYQAQLRRLASELSLTEERERRRIAQELHDQVGHNLARMKFQLQELRPRQGSIELDTVLQVLEETIHASRNLTFELSPPVLHELGLGAALEWLVHQLQVNYGVAGEYGDDRQLKPLSEDMRVVLFQAVRELLVNVGKHAQAASAHVRACVDDGMIRIEVEDDGRGFDPAAVHQRTAAGFGLFSIHERLAHMGGAMTIDAAPGRGTKIILTAPLAGEEGTAFPVSLETTHEGAARRRITILLADDQTLTREGLRSLLDRLPDMQVVAEAADGEQAIALAEQHTPDVVVMDIAMPRLNGIEATRRIVQALPATKVIALSMHADGQFVLEMLRAGAAGYLLKDCAQEDLAQAIRMVDANLTFLSPGIADSVVQDYVRSRTPEKPGPAASLTAREMEVLKLLVDGYNTKQIAGQMGVSGKTVEAHRQHIMDKLDIHGIAELTRYAIKEGLVKLEG